MFYQLLYHQNYTSTSLWCEFLSNIFFVQGTKNRWCVTVFSWGCMAFFSFRPALFLASKIGLDDTKKTLCGTIKKTLCGGGLLIMLPWPVHDDFWRQKSLCGGCGHFISRNENLAPPERVVYSAR